MTASLHGLMAEFDDSDALAAAAGAAKRAGYRRIDAFSPFLVEAASDIVGYRGWILPTLAGMAAIVGAAIYYGAAYWMNVVDYPLNVGGRPLHSWPAFLPAVAIVAILWAGAASLIGMLVLIGLPRLHHPVFEVEGFERASSDRFFLLLRSDDPAFDAQRTSEFLEGLAPLAIHAVPA